VVDLIYEVHYILKEGIDNLIIGFEIIFKEEALD